MEMEKPLTRNIRPGQEPLDILAYQAAGGYQAVHKAIKNMTPQQVIDEVKAANLLGRGGAGFPAGVKWGFVSPQAPHPRYLIINADEMEPATFKDRFLMEGDPHQLIEGIILAAYAIQADVAYIFLRWEYKLAAQRLRKAIAEAYQRGYLGRNILDSGWGLELRLHVSAGRYMCGEETGLLNALEGKRANPRSKPPFPATVGLWGRPSNVNNVETICNVPHIINNGSAWFLSLSHTDEGGTKIYGASGRVKRPGAFEAPMGTPLREILEEYAGGMQDGYKLRAILPGGASTAFVLPEHLDTPMDFKNMAKIGSSLGTGTIMVVDDHTCPIGVMENLEHFFAQESCGWCTPCWAGLRWSARILKSFEEGEGRMEDLPVLEDHTHRLIPGTTYCALATVAMNPLSSGVRYFRDEFERHAREQRCPWR